MTGERCWLTLQRESCCNIHVVSNQHVVHLKLTECLRIITINEQDPAFPAKLTGLDLSTLILPCFPCPNAKVPATTFPKVSPWYREGGRQEKQNKRSQGDSLNWSNEYPTLTKPKGGRTMTESWLTQSRANVRLGTNRELARNPNQSLLLWNPEVCDLTTPSGDSYAHQSLRNAAGKYSWWKAPMAISRSR